MTTKRTATEGPLAGSGKRVHQKRSAVALEYILVCALLVLGLVGGVPVAMALFQYAYQVIAAVVCSPFPAGL